MTVEGRRLALSDLVLSQLRNGSVVVTVGLDDEWLKQDGKAGAAEARGPESTRQGYAADDITPTGTFASMAHSTAYSTASPMSPPDGTRLSGLFQGWLEANQRPAPPPSQASVASDVSRDLKPDFRRILHADDVFAQDGVDTRVARLEATDQAMGDERTGSHQTAISPEPPQLAPTALFPLSPTLRLASTSLSAASQATLDQSSMPTTGPGLVDPPTSPNMPVRGWSPRVPIPGFIGWGAASTSGESDTDQISLSAAGASLRKADMHSGRTSSTGGLWAWWTGANKPEAGSAEAMLVSIQDT